MVQSENTKGSVGVATALALSAAVISGSANFLNKIAVTAVKDAVVFTSLKNALVGLVLVGLVLALKKLPEIRALNRGQWLKLLAVGVIGGSVPFALFFAGLIQTSAVNASLIHKTLFIWVILLAAPLLKEKMSPGQWLGVAAIFGANLLVGGFKGFRYNAGELMILGATLLWAVENVLAKMALKDVSSATVAAARMTIGSLVLLPIAAARGGLGAVMDMNAVNWSWALLSAAVLTAFVTVWYAALKRAPASYVATLLVSATLVTNVLSAAFITHSFAGMQWASVYLFAFGSFLVIYFSRSRRQNRAVSPA